ncbi:MAG TPA: hypothetical protein VKB93_19670 [Thermoanaerobaculia bacterium]|nr:hypothetical protein [Thermoanaerobaculia bacterium]
MNLDISSITETMTGAVRHAIGERWSVIRAVAEPELRKLAQTLEDVQQMYASGEINSSHASQLVEMQRNAAVSVLRTVEGLGILTARAAIDSAAHAVADVVNRVTGIKLL